MLMKKMLGSLALCALTLLGSPASAAPVSLGTIERSYGSALGHVGASNSGTGSCDTLNSNSITVRDTSSGCSRFADLFDFSGMGYANVTSLTLTLSFGSTNGRILGFSNESWFVRPASGSTGTAWPEYWLFGLQDAALATQSFTFNALDLSLFNSIASQGKFYLWFAEDTLSSDSFILYSSKLEVFGNRSAAAQIPEPSSLALVSLAALGLGLASRRRRQH